MIGIDLVWWIWGLIAYCWRFMVQCKAMLFDNGHVGLMDIGHGQ